MRSIDFCDVANLKVNYILIDVRSPEEYKSATIPGAINLPLFDDEERKIIGRTYVQESIEKAKIIGIEAISKKLPQIFEFILQLKKKYHSLIFFCSKEGMRSSSLVALLTSLGINALTLTGGYKGYRNYIIKEFNNVVAEVKFVVIHGNTGVGKTAILKKLKELGQDVLDLEECANHRGSFFGSVGLGEQYSQKQFESLVYNTLKLRKSNCVFVEGESKRIGRIIIPESLFNAMTNGVHVEVTADINVRVKNIVSDYSKGSNKEIIEAISLLNKHISNKLVDKYIEKVMVNNYEEVAYDLMTTYYDPMYSNDKTEYKFVLVNHDTKLLCEKLIDLLGEN
jgi:tRNA 2-selenouridine synthase